MREDDCCPIAGVAAAIEGNKKTQLKKVSAAFSNFAPSDKLGR